MTWPFENDTDAVVKKLARRSMHSEKRRNLMVVIAVALAAFLICFAGTLAVSLLQIQSNQVLDTYEAVFHDVSEQDVKALRELPGIARVGEYYMLEEESSPQGFHASIVYGDEDLIYIARQQMKLTAGRMAQAANEVVVSESWLSRYVPGLEPGQTVELNTQTLQGEFIVCGIMDTPVDESQNTYPFLISKAALQAGGGYHADGYRAYVHLNDTQIDVDGMEAYFRQVAKDLGLSAPGLNGAYFSFMDNAVSLDRVSVVALLAGIVLIGGAIVIQSIFRISINDKIQSYGQLRTIGATRKQIKRIVKKEGRQLGGIGILVGTLLGACCALILFPGGFQVFSYAAAVLLTALICWLMVSLSIRKPVKIASGISPLEAVRFLPAQWGPSRSRRPRAKLSPVSLGVMNFKRDRKKTISIAVSLSIGAVALLVVSSMLLVMSPEQMARLRFPDGDYKVYIHSDREHSDILRSGNPLTDALKQELLSVDGITDMIVKRESAHAQYWTPNNSGSGMCDMLTEQNLIEVEQALVSGTMPTDGRSILLPKDDQYHADMGVGATVEVTFGERTVPVTVCGQFDMGKLHTGHGIGLDGPMLYATQALFEELLPGIENYDYSWSIVSDPEQAQSVEAALNRIAAGHADLGIDMFAVRRDFFAYQNTLVFGGLKAVSWLVFVFGVVNLINTTLSNQMARKRENNILRSVGLTKRQLYQMVVCEGLCYALSTMLVSLAVGLPIALFVCRLASMGAYGGLIVAYQFPFPEMLLFAFVLFALTFLLSLWTIHKQTKQPIVEQI